MSVCALVCAGELRSGKYTLTTFGLFQGQAVLKINVLHRFSIPLDRFLPKTLPRCIARPGSLPMFPDEDLKNRLSSGVSPQKRGWKAQRKVREPLGYVRGPSFESMAIVFAIDGACLPTSVRRAYLPHAVVERSSRRYAPQDDVNENASG